MTLTEILEEISKLTNAERLTIIEAASHLIREDLRLSEHPLSETERKHRMTLAAEALLADYTSDTELTAFTALDGEEFHEEG